MSAFARIPCPWLDVTRLLTRVGRGTLTGIDRVELAYLRAAIETGCESYLCRTTRGYLRLDRIGAGRLLEMADGTRPLGSADMLSKLTLRGNRPRHRVEATLREVAVDRCGPRGLSALIARGPNRDLTYINVGHSNLSRATLSAFGAREGARVMVMIHDLIPLTHPDYVADGQPANFAGRVERVRRHATHVIANSKATSDSLDAHWSGQEKPPHRIIAPLGVEARPMPKDATRDSNLFVMLGTIEARKNHALMLDAWDLLAKELPADRMPHLHIIGAIGWKVEAFVERLKSHPLFGDRITLNGPGGLLDDAAVRNRLAKASALLFPSIAEGYGYPPLEAAMAGAVPICSNLPVFRETLGDCAVYVDSYEAYSWAETIKQHLCGTAVKPGLTKLKVTTWAEHFEMVAEAV
ncbi:glycosyltransferase family 4 protein [Gymnodinialimonas ceratoperidinii]|uniref:Glycosyltransferase family 4 protein n=1 Tax=Gymnodinialimonas ceratoperidinii TaxID=2856823 RepID=A0A8F6TWL7_9RHOB|nr:glycosyltransferase family 1 protein [Gymnodinialimonas ceratoperidinii]QXT40020.1 glycosyltransferase family 4 protein [Gymnodinialimonas ceratoperidinii]